MKYGLSIHGSPIGDKIAALTATKKQNTEIFHIEADSTMLLESL